MTQFARPESDVEVGDWITAPLWSKLDEASPDDLDFIVASDPGFCEIALSAIDAPSGGNVVLRVRHRLQAGSDAAPLAVTLVQGATAIATRSIDVDSEDWVTSSIVLSAGERAAITDWSDLRVRLSRASSSTPSGAVLYEGSQVVYNGDPVVYSS